MVTASTEQTVNDRVPSAKFSLQIAWTLATRLLMVVNSILAGIVVARWLGAEGVGQLGVINVSVALIVQLGSLGLPSANTYFIAKNQNHYATAAFNSVCFAIVVGGLLALGLVVFARLRPDWFGFISPDLIRIAAISIPFQLLSLVGLNIFLAVGQVRRFNLLDLAGQTFVLINALVALVILHQNLWTLVKLNTASSIAIGFLVTALIVSFGRRLRKEYGSWRLDLKLLSRMLVYGLKFHISILAGALMFRADLLVVNHFRGAAEAGVYSVATQVSMMLMLLPGVIATLLFPRVTAEQDASGKSTALVTRHTAFVMLIVCLAAVPFSFLIPTFYGGAFSDSPLQLLILLPGVYLIGLESVVVQHFNAVGLPRLIPLFWVVTLAANILLLVLLVPRFGARGAAAASTISYFLITVLVVSYFRSKTTKRLGEILLLRADELRRLLSLGILRNINGGVSR